MKIPKHVTDYIENINQATLFLTKSALDLYLFRR